MTSWKRFSCWAAAALVATSVASARAEPVAAASPHASDIALVDRYRNRTWRWQRVMGVRLTPARAAPTRMGRDARRTVVDLWRARAERANRRAHDPPHLAAWRCIHRHEGPWDANTGNGYYGGLQMDLPFQREYGADLLRRKGPAHRWRPIEQIWVAVRAYRAGRGFSPWPNTARTCGHS